MDIGTKIKHLRELKKITVKEMAIRLNMSETGYNKIERGDTDLPYSRLNQIAEVLEEKVENLINFDPKQFFHQNRINTVNGNVYSSISDKERKLYEDHIKLLEEKVILLQDRLKNAEKH